MALMMADFWKGPDRWQRVFPSGALTRVCGCSSCCGDGAPPGKAGQTRIMGLRGCPRKATYCRSGVPSPSERGEDGLICRARLDLTIINSES